jgi:hypothetical protein
MIFFLFGVCWDPWQVDIMLCEGQKEIEGDLERVRSRKEIMVAGKAKMVPIGRPIEGVHFVKDVVDNRNIHNNHVRRRLENVSMVLLGSMMEQMTVQADREHVGACY